MNAMISENLISDLSDSIESRLGISLARERWGQLEKKISMAADSWGFADAASCIQWLLSSRTDKRTLEMLASCLTVGETYFFRQSSGLRAMVERAFPDIIRSHAHGDRRVRIWSAGCSTGEEPYSVAMMVAEYPALRGWDVGILGTDINQSFLMKAEAGIYTEWSFRGVEPGIREKFFQKKKGPTFEILPSLKRMVTFAHLNLIDDVYPALLNNTNAIDLILCRNVLMYFTPDFIQKVILKLHQSLLPEGWLLLSPVEAPLVHGSLFTPLSCAGAILHRKTAEKTEPMATPQKQTTTRAPKRRATERPVPARPAQIAKRPKPAATYPRAIELYANTDYNGAIEILTSLAVRPAADAAVFQLLSRAYANLGRLAEAESWCMRAIAADKINAASRYLLALIRIEQQRPDEAIAALKKAIYLEPDLVVAHFTLANLYRRKSMRHEADRHLNNALLALQGVRANEELPESEGMTAGNLIDLIAATRADGGNNGQRRTD
jgi:chemotaxis protein methyltransferase CheR